MQIQPINNTKTTPQKIKKTNYVKISGYSSLGFGVASIIAAKQHKIKAHKSLAYLTAATALWHVGLIEYNHYKFKHKKKDEI